MQTQRLWIDGELNAADDIDTSELAARLRAKQGDDDSYAWIDLTRDSTGLLTDLAQKLDLHALAVEDALNVRERQKVTRFDSHVLLRASDVRLDENDRVQSSFLTAFITPHVVLTVRDDDFPVDAVRERLDGNQALATYGPGFVIWGILDVVVDHVMEVLETLDDRSEQLGHDLFVATTDQGQLQQDAFELRRAVARLRHLTVPMRDLVSTLGRRDSTIVTTGLQPYFADVFDHAIHAVEWTDSMRDYVASVLETNIALQGNRMNDIMKKVTSWAAIIAVPTLITGFFGQNLGFFGINTGWGAWLSVALIVVSSVVLYLQFRRRDWL